MRSIFTFTIAVLILTACSQTPIPATSTPLPSITPTRISTVTPTVLPIFTPITPEQLADMKKQAKEKLGDLADIDEKDMQYLPLGYIVSGRTITSAELLLVPEKNNPKIGNLYLLTLIGVDSDKDPDQFSNVKEVFSPISTDDEGNVVFIDPETGESSIWMSPVPGDDKNMQMFVLGFDGELSDTSVILPITLILPKGAGKNSAPLNVNSKSGINFVDGESGPEYTHNDVTYRLDTAKGAWVEVPKVDPDNRVDVGEGMTESLNDLKVDLGDGVVYQFEFASTEAKQKVKHACDVAGWATWMAARGAENRQYVSFADWWSGVQANGGKFSGAQELVHYKDHEGKDPKGIGFNNMGMTKPVDGEVDFSTCTLKIVAPSNPRGTPQVNGLWLPGVEFGFTFDENGKSRVALAMGHKTPVYDFFYANKDRTPAQNEDAFSAMVAKFVEDMNRLENAKPSAFKINGTLIGMGEDLAKDQYQIRFADKAVSTYEIKKFLETDEPFLRLKK